MLLVNGLVFRAAVALTTISSFGFASDVPAEDSRLEVSGYFACDATLAQRLCCTGEVGIDGSVADCQMSQDVILGRDAQASLGVPTTNACTSRQRNDGYAVAVCCGSKELEQAGHDTYRGADCVKSSTLSKPLQNKARADAPVKRTQLPSALKLLGLPTPKKSRVRSSVESTSRRGEDASRSDSSSKDGLPQAAEPRKGKHASDNARKDRRTAGIASTDATHMLGLPVAKKGRSEPPKAAAKAKRAVETEPEAGNAAKPAVAQGAPSAAERVGLPAVKANKREAHDEGAQFTRRSRKVNAALAKVRAQEVNVKGPRWIPSKGFMFVG